MEHVNSRIWKWCIFKESMLGDGEVLRFKEWNVAQKIILNTLRIEQLNESTVVVMIWRIPPSYFIIDLSLFQYANKLCKKIFISKQVIDFAELEDVCIKNILRSHKV